METAVISTKRLTKFLVIGVLSITLVLTGLVAQTNQAHAATSPYHHYITEQAIPFLYLDPEEQGFVPFPGLMTGYVSWTVASPPETNLNQVDFVESGTTVTNANQYPVTIIVDSYITANNGATTIRGPIHDCLAPRGSAMICNRTTQPVAITSPIFKHVEVATTDGAGLLASNNFTHNWNLV